MNPDEHLDDIATLHDETEEAQSVFLATRQERDIAIREAITEGVTMYAIAKRIGRPEQSIAKIRDRG